MIKIILAILLISAPLCAGNWKEDHPIYAAILELRPSMDRKLAFELSNHIHKQVKLQGLDPYRAVAIAMQESSLRNVHRYRRKLPTDIGMFQIHVGSVDLFGLDKQRLLDHDLSYAVEAYVTIMKEKLQICKHLGEEAWSCYHSGTPKYRKRYVKAVNRWYRRIAK